MSSTGASPKRYADILLPLALPKAYTYAVPIEWQDLVKPGCRAEVVFGKNKRYAGLILSLSAVKPDYATKPLAALLDEEPVVTELQLALWKWMACYYLCTEGEVMAAALPSFFKLSSETLIVEHPEAVPDSQLLDDQEYLLAEALHIRKQLRLSEIQQILDQRTVYPVVRRLLEKGGCLIHEQLQERYKPRKEYFVSLRVTYQDEQALSELMNQWKGAPRQLDLLMSFWQLSRGRDEVPRTELLQASGATTVQLNALVDKQILAVEHRRVDRLPRMAPHIRIDFRLSDLQREALQAIHASFAERPVCLLHGVTGSGKTEIYIELMRPYVEAGRQVLFLLPEIALTAQIIRRLQHHLGGHVAVYHSKFSDAERVEIWNRVRRKEVTVVLGPRSALLLPFADLGLIIVDEEHDTSYKQQDPAPRYHARDTALYYASRCGAQVLLGSATPSLESYQHASTGKYGLVTLPERYGGMALPEIEVVRPLDESGRKRLMISDTLQADMIRVLQEGRQVILFQNRRGYDPYRMCGACGHIPQCLQCDVSLTLHKSSGRLHCHYCGSVYPNPLQCEACGSVAWTERNFGTEKIEEQLAERCAGYRVARMDVDSVRGKNAHDTLIREFEARQLEVLVGTQMVVKGLDFGHVSLVGILDADGLLGFSDFRVNERAFQLMEQVSGRAGRKDIPGKVVIQTLRPGHPVIEWVRRHDYAAFFEHEREARRQFRYPPFCRLVKLTFRHRDREKAEAAAHRIAEALRAESGHEVIGPAVPVIPRLRNLYQMELLLKVDIQPRMGERSKNLVRHHIFTLQADKILRSVVVITDVDPL